MARPRCPYMVYCLYPIVPYILLVSFVLCCHNHSHRNKDILLFLWKRILRSRCVNAPESFGTYLIALSRFTFSLNTNYVNDSSTSTKMSQLLHRRSHPDVPEDIEDDPFFHFNDLNYDLHSDSSSTIVASDSTSTFKPAEKCEDGWTSVPTTSPQGDREFQLRLDETQANSEGSSIAAPLME